MSHTAKRIHDIEKEKGVTPGTPEWFKLWFSLPYLKESITESLDNPYPFELIGPNDSQEFSALAQTPNGMLRMDFEATDYDNFGIDFSVGKSMGKTEAGDEFKVFATVVAMMTKWIKTVGIEHVESFDFGANKGEHASDGRAKLYTRFAKQLASKLGWKLDQSTTGNGDTAFFKLTNPNPTPREQEYWDALEETVNEATEMKISDLTISDAGMAIAQSVGGGSRTDAPLAVTKLPSGHVYLVNGYHRLVDAMNSGKDTVSVEYVPYEKVEILWKQEREQDIKYGKQFNEEVEVSLHGDAKKGYTLSKIEVSGDERNAGQGTKAMQDIVDRMDAEGAIIALTPDDAFGGNKNRLIKFYKRFGFVPNKGRNKDFRFRETMIRYPQSNESVNEGYKLKLERDTDMMVLNITDTTTGKRTEVRGKAGYETNGYDANDKLHKLLDKISKSANISELMNGEVVGINPKHPDGASAKSATDTAFNENFADGKVKGKSRPGRVKKSGASCNGSVTELRAKAKKASGEKAKMYHWCANMKAGKKK